MKEAERSADLSGRHRIEKDFHDRRAHASTDDFYSYGALETADRYVLECLGDLRGLRVLELGCGAGETSLWLAKAGATVMAIDISPEMIAVARRRAAEAGLTIEARAMSAEELDFPDGSFDVVYGHSILHHLNLNMVIPRLLRILRPGGRAAFLEPLDHNPLIAAFRKLTPHRRTPTEQPLAFRNVEEIGSRFTGWKHREFYLVSLLAFVWYYAVNNKSLFRWTLRALEPVDRALFTVVPPLRRFAWVTVIQLTR